MKMKIAQFDRNPLEGLCTVAHWTATKQDGGYTAYAYGLIDLPAKDPSDPTFVPYEDITEELAVQWVEKVMGEEQVTNLEVSLAAQIEAQKNPVTATGVPWDV
jgi:hypothetical protein